MRTAGWIFSLIFIASLACFSPAQASWFNSEAVAPEQKATIEDAPFTFGSFREIAKEMSPTVVNISTTTVIKRRQFSPHRQRTPFDNFFGDDFFRHFFDNQPENQKMQSLGSGVVIDESGYILTNDHVVDETDSIQVTTLDGKTYDAEVIGVDSQTDIALIKIVPDEPLKAIPQGDSDILEVGDWVMAIGNPFGFGHTVTVGVVSAKGRSLGNLMDDLPYQDFIQTDASINPGNSGGPLLDIHGRLIGINSVIASRTGQSAGIGFAIPINLIQPIVKQLKEKGTVTRGWLGVTIQSLNNDLTESMGLDSNKGALVAEVLEDGPADKGGVKLQDVIIKVNGKDVLDSGHLSRLIAATPVDEAVTLVVIRNGKQKVLTVKLGERPENPRDLKFSSGTVSDLGMSVQEITPQIARQMELEEQTGVLISEVEPDGAADRAGLRRGDVILEFNQTKVDSVRHYKELAGKLKSGDGAVLYVQRGDSKIFVAIKVP